jgi:hypothetical protein
MAERLQGDPLMPTETRYPLHLRGKRTQRGFERYTFQDAYNFPCSLQGSSWAEADAIWFGVDNNRMHLTQAQVAELLPLLQHFAATGALPESQETP